MKICILAAGKGARMGTYSKKINKSLLPIENKAAISHIIELFHETDEFVIGLGYLGYQVKDYLRAAHPNIKFQFVNIKNFDGKGSGPGFSLLKCKKFLNESFFFLPCDGIFPNKINFRYNKNWIGIAKVSSDESNKYCNIAVKNNRVADIRDKTIVNDDYFVFTGLLYVKDYHEFWKSLEKSSLIKNEHQISDGLHGLMKNSGLFVKDVKWFDFGDIEKYHKIQKKFHSSSISKTNEFIYFTDNNVIKFFADIKIIDNRIIKTKHNPSVFPKVKRLGKNFYQYPYWNGDTFYSNGTPILFKKLLNWLENNVWIKYKIPNSRMKELCETFYHTKTNSRISLFLSDNPDYIFPKFINGKITPSLEKLFQQIPWKELFCGIPSFIHGDLQFQNILYNKKSKKFLLVDWRQDFAGSTKFGDLYYDLAKLYGGILMNYDHVIKDNFQYQHTGNKVIVSFKKWKNASEYKKILDDYINKNNFDKYKVQLLTGLIYLNMAALHHKPFNFALISYGSCIIRDALNEKKLSFK